MIYNTIPCLVCGEDVHNVLTNCVICDKCKSVILKMRKQMEFNSTPKTFVVRFIDKNGDAVYITKSPKHITENNIKSQIKVLKDEVVEQSYRFDSDIENAKFFTRTQADKLCRNFHLLQENGHFNEFVKIEVVKDNQVVFYRDFEKYKLED